MGIGARIAAFFAGMGGYVVAAGAGLLAIAGLVARIRSDGKAAGRTEVREAARKDQDNAVRQHAEIENRINAGSGDAARERLRNNWRRED